MRLRVLQVIPVLYVGGLERVATTLTIGLSSRVERVVVCSHGGDPFATVLAAAGIEILPIPRPRPRPKALLLSAFAISRALRRERPHVVHAHNPAAGIAAWLARLIARMPRVPIVTTYHGVVPGRVSLASRVLAATSNVVVGVGPTSTRALVDAGLEPTHARTIHNAVAPDPQRGSAEVREEFAADAGLIVTVGRYVDEKNQALLLQAVARIAPDFPGLRVLIVGDGPLEPDLRSLVSSLGLGEVATITGERTDAVDLTAAADVFVLSSDSEGLPLVLLEAMSLGTTVVSTDAGGTGDVVEDERSGLLVPTRDVDALADALRRLLAEPELRARLAATAREAVASTSSPEVMVSAYLALYQELVERRRAIA